MSARNRNLATIAYALIGGALAWVVVLWLPSQTPEQRQTTQTKQPVLWDPEPWPEVRLGAQSWEQPSPAPALDSEALSWNNRAVEQAERRDFVAAVQSLRYARARDPRSPVLKKNLQQVLLAWAAERARAEEWMQARDLLEEAFELGGGADVAYLLGLAWQKTGEKQRARSLWEKAIEESPRDSRLLVSLAELYEQEGLRAEALDLLYRAQAAGAKVEGLRSRIERLEREVDAEWEYEASRSPHFRFRYPDTLPPSLRGQLADVFEEARVVVARFFEVEPLSQVEVVLYDAPRFEHVTRAPGWAAGAFSGRIQLPLTSVESAEPEALARVARHEMAHAVLAALSAAAVPAWVHEGLAMHAEDFTRGERSAWAQELVANSATRLGDLPPSFLSLSGEEARVAYALSYRAVQLLLNQHGVQKVLNLLKNDGQSFEARFRELTGQEFTDFSNRLRY